MHKNFLPATSAEIGGLFLMVVLVMICTAGGAGAAAPLMALMMMFNGFDIKDVIGQLHFANFVGCLARLVYSFSNKHPTKPWKTLIDFDFTIVMLPGILFSTTFGLLINKVLPPFVIITALVILMSFLTYKTFLKAVAFWRKEK